MAIEPQASIRASAPMNPQHDCPLFDKLPAEIREQVWQYAVTSYPDVTKPYRLDHFYYRPGYHYHTRTDIDLLLTCQRIYNEAALLPIAVNEHTFWLFRGPTPYMKRSVKGSIFQWDNWYRKLNASQQLAIQRVHIFPQQPHFENSMPNFCFRTRQLKLTFRNADWWSWELPVKVGPSSQLGMCPWLKGPVSRFKMEEQPLAVGLDGLEDKMRDQESWGWRVCQIEGLEVLEIEFETDVQKKEQLDAVLERAKHWKFPLVKRKSILQWDSTIQHSSWEGLKDLFDPNWGNVLRERVPPTGPKRTYYVATMAWKRTL